MKYIIANWKSHKSLEESLNWCQEWAGVYKANPDVMVVVAPPFPYLYQLAEKIKNLNLTNIAVASQDISAFPLGAYTGAVTASMLQPAVTFAIVGHSERRNYFHETHQEIANKLIQLAEFNIKPILCVDEPYAQEQLAAVEERLKENLIIAYEPLEAIGSGTPQDPKQVEEVVKKIQNYLEGKTASILYGGSVNGENAKNYLSVPGVAGLLVGGASLETGKFIKIVEANLHSKSNCTT